MEEKIMEMIRELSEPEADRELEATEMVDNLLDEIALDELSMAIEEEFGAIIDPSDMEDISIAQLCSLIQEES